MGTRQSVVLTFESVSEIVSCDHLSGTSSAVLSFKYFALRDFGFFLIHFFFGPLEGEMVKGMV